MGAAPFAFNALPLSPPKRQKNQTMNARIRILFSAIALLAVTGCAEVATPYQTDSIMRIGTPGGYSEREIAPGVWRITFGATGSTNRETLQTYWLYRAASLATERGYDGFEVASGLKLSDASRPIQIAAGTPIFIPIPSGPGPNTADGTVLHMVGDARLVKRPFAFSPPASFDAQALKTALEPHVTGEKCEHGNVCPHPHDYLRAD
jgi:hypothetical protein